jgi:hypothetical protein
MIYIDSTFRFYDDSKDLTKWPELKPPAGAVPLTDQQVKEITANIKLWRWHPTEGKPYKVPDCEEKYLKMVDGVIIEMTVGEKAIVDCDPKYLKIVDGKTVIMTDEEKADIDKTDADSAFADIRLRKAEEIHAVREAKIAAGVPYDFPDGGGTIQTRDMTDARNIQTSVISALILQAAGETKPVLVFRDMEDVSHSMTPAQVLEMGLYVAQYGQAIYSASWQLRDMAKTMTAEEIAAFDVASGWPA